MSAAVAESPQKQLTLRDRLNSEGMKKHLAMALPKHVTPDRMVRVALTAMTRSPKLADCDQASFFQALFQCSQWGLEPDGRRAHLIPFENKRRGVIECQLIIDYKGLAELAYRSSLVKTIHAQEVRRGDLFSYDLGQVTRHTPWFLRSDPGKPATAGDVYAFYCVVEMAGDARKCEVMSLEEVNAIRDNSQGYKAAIKYKSSSPWIDYPLEMGKKTVFKRCSKWLPLSAEFRQAVDHDDTEYAEHVDEERKTVDSISGLLAAADDDLPTIPEGVADDGEIAPWSDLEIKAQFDDLKDESEVPALTIRLLSLYQDRATDLDLLENITMQRLRDAKAPKKGKDGKLPLGG